MFAPAKVIDVELGRLVDVDGLHGYDRVRGVSYWTKNYRTSVEQDDPDALSRLYEYYDPTTGFGHGSDLFSWTAALFLDVVLED